MPSFIFYQLRCLFQIFAVCSPLAFPHSANGSLHISNWITLPLVSGINGQIYRFDRSCIQSSSSFPILYIHRAALLSTHSKTVTSVLGITGSKVALPCNITPPMQDDAVAPDTVVQGRHHKAHLQCRCAKKTSVDQARHVTGQAVSRQGEPQPGGHPFHAVSGVPHRGRRGGVQV
ncbi:hypothetical protein CEXT_136681 [Caerostris extrusa]|uniref:Secreted protein n=1 Tax=Caerostris extrusa TaxID=172846 RepID=A0AAV4X7K1_CAEEX|nr:hypothetical protein CEXT_136681 [Caerostris extrusa]